MLAFTLIVFMAAVVFGIVVLSLLLLRERRAFRAAGISDAQPACAKCRHLMRGWRSPNCPECGSDVRVVGIVTGSSRARGLAGQLAVLVAVAVGILSFSTKLALAGLDQRTVTMVKVTRISAVEPSLSVKLDIRLERSRSDSARSLSGELVVQRTQTENSAGDPEARTAMPITAASDSPSRAEIRTALGRVAGTLDAAQLDAHADALAGIVDSAKLDPMAPVVEAPWRSKARTASVVTAPASVGYGFLALPVIALLIGAVLTDKWFPKPRCQPRDGEWSV